MKIGIFADTFSTLVLVQLVTGSQDHQVYLVQSPTSRTSPRLRLSAGYNTILMINTSRQTRTVLTENVDGVL